MLHPTFHARLVSCRPIVPNVRELVFEREEGAFEFEPGQWVNLVLPTDDGEIRRAYSIASPPDGTSRFEIAVTRVVNGPGSQALHALEPGSVVRAIGPQGFFTRPIEGGPPSLFVGTGTGATPLRSMLLAAIARGANEPLWMLIGVRHEEDAIYRAELEALAERHPNLRVLYTLSRPTDAWTGLRGYVQTHVPKLLGELTAASTEPPHVYVCGLERMVKAVRDVARKDLGLSRDRVHSERYD